MIVAVEIFAITCSVRFVANIYGTPEQLDQVFKALADSSRRSIVAQLATRGELSVSEASENLELSPAGVSKHLRVLEDAGVISRRLEGRRHVLSLESERLLLAQDWIDRYRTTWTASLDRLAQLAAEIERAEEAQ